MQRTCKIGGSNSAGHGDYKKDLNRNTKNSKHNDRDEKKKNVNRLNSKLDTVKERICILEGGSKETIQDRTQTMKKEPRESNSRKQCFDWTI